MARLFLDSPMSGVSFRTLVLYGVILMAWVCCSVHPLVNAAEPSSVFESQPLASPSMDAIPVAPRAKTSWFSTLKPLKPQSSESSVPSVSSQAPQNPVTSEAVKPEMPLAMSAEDVRTQLKTCLEQHTEFMTLSSLLELTAVQWLPSDTSQLTFLAPTNLAFTLLPAGKLEWYLAPEHQVELITLLQYHSIAELDLDSKGSFSTRKKDVFNQPKTLYGKPVVLKQHRLSQRLKSGVKDTVSLRVQGSGKLTTAYYNQALRCETSPAITILPIVQVITPKP